MDVLHYRWMPREAVRWAIASVLLLLFSGSCTRALSPSEQLDMLLNSRTNCVAPCWQGLTPGISTVGDFIAVVDASPSQNFSDLQENTLNEGDSQYIWEDRSVPAVMEMETTGTTISYFGFLPHRSTITLGTNLEVMGSPDMHITFITTREAPLLVLYMFYEERGVVVEVRQRPFDSNEYTPQSICEVAVKDEFPVREIFLLEPAPASQMRETLSRLVPDLEPISWQSKENVQLSACDSNPD